MADRSVAITLKANVSGLVAGLKTAQTAATDLATKGLDKIGKHEKSINTLSNGFGALGLALTGAAVLAVKAFADFDQAMANVASTGDDARGSLDALRDAAMEAGARTAFSATEAAGAIEELAKAGVSTADILNGGLDGALDLAAAGGLEVADAAGIAAVALKQFGLRGQDMTHVSDLLAAGAGKAMGSVDDLGAALAQSGLVANQVGLSIEETTAALSAFASAGLLGSDAGTSLKTMLQRLNPTTLEAQEQFDALGISAYDAQGNFVGLESFAGQLQTSMKDLTPEARNAALAVMFGSDAVRGASVLYEEGAAGIEKWTAAVDDQGYAAEVAATRMDTLAGDLETLQGSFETLMIGLGEGANGPLRGLVQGVTDAINAFAELPSWVQNSTLAIVGGGGLVALGLAGLGKLAIGVNDTTTALKDMGIISGATGGKIGNLAGALTKVAGVAVGVAATAAATSLLVDALTTGEATLGANELERALQDVIDTGGDLSQVDAAFQNTGKFLGLARTQTDSLVMAFAQLANPSVTDRVAGFFDMFVPGAGYMEILEQRATEVDAALSGMVSAGDVQGVREFQDSLIGAGFSMEEINDLLPQTKDALIGAREAATTASEGQGEFAGATVDATGAAVEQVDALQELIDAQAELAGVVLSQRDAQRNLEQAVADATGSLTENGATLDITTEKGRANQSALDDIAGSTWDLIESMKANNASQSEVQGVMATSRERFVAAATAMGMGADEANNLANELGLIPENVTTNVSTTGTGEAVAAIQRVTDSLGRLPKSINIPVNITGDHPVARGAGGAGGLTYATGGYVSGPGSMTSDSIPARLSNGEYVVKASAVQQYGRAFFDSVNAQRFASGGFVGQSSAPVPVSASRHTELHVHNEGRPVTSQDIVFAQKRLEALEPTW